MVMSCVETSIPNYITSKFIHQHFVKKFLTIRGGRVGVLKLLNNESSTEHPLIIISIKIQTALYPYRCFETCLTYFTCGRFLLLKVHVKFLLSCWYCSSLAQPFPNFNLWCQHNQGIFANYQYLKMGFDDIFSNILFRSSI